MENIKVASQEQAEGVDQINKAINEMDRITQENSALVEQNTTASQHMAEEAENLQNLLNTFRVDDTESLPEHQEKPQIILDIDTNQDEESDQIILEDTQNKEKKMDIIKNDVEKKLAPFE